MNKLTLLLLVSAISGHKLIKFDPTQDKKLFAEVDNELAQA